MCENTKEIGDISDYLGIGHKGQLEVSRKRGKSEIMEKGVWSSGFQISLFPFSWKE
jgi:hypothetical protein